MKIINYFINEKVLAIDKSRKEFREISALLKRLKEKEKIEDYKIIKQNEAFPTEEDKTKFLKELSNFAITRHVGLARVFGSRRYGFSYMPMQFILVYENNIITEVFPCLFGRKEVEILDFLRPVSRGEPWTRFSKPVGKTSRHELMIERIINNPDLLEKNLSLFGRNIRVGSIFSFYGVIDLIFKDKNNRYILLEVKVRPNEIDEGIGQILRHSELFLEQNQISREKIRIGIVCPYIPQAYLRVCGNSGIECFQVLD